MLAATGIIGGMESQALQSRTAPADRPLTSRSRITNKPLRRANGNTAVGRRVRDLFNAFLERMGNPADAISQAAALNAAELTVALEQARLAAARGESVDVDQLVRLSNLVARAEKRLGIDRRREPTAAPLREYLASAPARASADEGSPA
jgi:hypothetical protein